MRMVGDGLFRIHTTMPTKVPQMPEPNGGQKEHKDDVCDGGGVHFFEVSREVYEDHRNSIVHQRFIFNDMTHVG